MSLADLIRQVIAEDGVTVTSIARNANLHRSTVSAWATGTRGAIRPPDPEALRRLARGLRRPESMVLAAAGVQLPPTSPADLGEVTVLALYRALRAPDRRLAEQILRIMADRETADADVSILPPPFGVTQNAGAAPAPSPEVEEHRLSQ
jgi:transcriptional regulator with XRE-family HTH domain